MKEFKVGDIVKYRSDSIHMVLEVVDFVPADTDQEVGTFEGKLLETDRSTYTVGETYGYYSTALFDLHIPPMTALEEKYFQALNELEYIYHGKV